MIRKFLNLLNQKAQALAMYALLVPLLFSTGGAAVELGWYYMNVSRLQNMADSAIIASAQVLTKKDNEFSNYRYNYYLPEVPEKLKPDDRKSLSGDLEAKKYISKNLEISSDWKDKDSVTDTFSNVELNFSKKIYPTKDAEDYPILYYEITLTETPNHFFDFFNSFGDIKITATAVAKFTQIPDTTDERHGPTFYEQMESLKADKVYDYWEVIQNEYKEEANELKAEMELEIATTGLDREIVKASYIEKLVAKYMERGVDKSTAENRATDDLTEDRSANKARERSVTTSGNWWLSGLTTYRTENLTLRGVGGTSWKEKQTDFDDLFINFIQDVNYKFKDDWDIDKPLPSGMKIPDSFINCNIMVYSAWYVWMDGL